MLVSYMQLMFPEQIPLTPAHEHAPAQEPLTQSLLIGPVQLWRRLQELPHVPQPMLHTPAPKQVYSPQLVAAVCAGQAPPLQYAGA